MQRNEIDSYHTQMDKRLKIKPATIKPLEEKPREKLPDTGLNKDSVDMPPPPPARLGNKSQSRSMGTPNKSKGNS
jgi:hypothetical protein